MRGFVCSRKLGTSSIHMNEPGLILCPENRSIPGLVWLGQCSAARNSSRASTLPQGKLLLAVFSLKREFDAGWVLMVLGYRQRRHHPSTIPHRKHRLADLNPTDL